MAPDPGAAKRRILLAVHVITVSTQLLELGVLVFAPDVKTFGPPTRDLQDLGRHFRCSYDFIVVGGSPSGAVIASRLSELHQWSVLLLETGQDEEDSHSQHDLLQDGACVQKTRPHFREGIVGGNIYLRGSKSEYDSWAESGNIGWDYASVLEYFKKSEDMRVPKYKGSNHYGTGGYLTVEEYKSYSSVTEIILSAGQELGYSENTEGFSKLYGALRNGMWCSASRTFLRPARHRKNLDISYNSRVERVIIDSDSTEVTGIIFKKFDKEYIIRSNKEIILSAGAIKSPHLLLMSGVGPEEHLRETGILPVISDLPVGYNLQDHIGFVGLSYTLNKPASDIYSRISNLKTSFQKVFYNGDHSVFQNIWDIVAFFNSKYSESSGEFPDLAVYISGSGGDYGLTEVFSKRKDSFSTLGILLRPRSRGVLRLRSTDPTVSPEIHANYLADQNDRRILVETVKIGLNLCNTTVLRAYGAEAEPLQPCDHLSFMSEEHLKCAMEHHTVSLGHYAGTCKMGPDTDPEAVVDPQLKVRGVKGLRVADASIMPTIVSTDLSAACVMIGEKASDLIKSDWVEITTSSSSSKEEYC